MIVEIGSVLATTDLFTERFCCDLPACKGACCVEGDAGAPVKTEEIAELEEAAEAIRDELTPAARDVIDRQGVVYPDVEGELVTSIIGSRECAFSRLSGIRAESGEAVSCRMCLLETAFRAGRTGFAKPVSCALYPLREKQLSNGMTALSYHEWSICEPARRKGARFDIPLYKFLHAPLVRRFGAEWVEEMEATARLFLSEYADK
ncbi:MAG: DUF3109 family protein [Prevotella sp.]|nr:DUF3109 family protein [Prevotella sp.]